MSNATRDKLLVFATIALDFFALAIVVLIGISFEDFLHDIDFREAFSQWHHYITPVMIGIIGSFLSFKFRLAQKREKIFSQEKQGILEKMSESESYFKTLMEQAPAVIEIYDLDGLQIAVNKAYEKLWSFPASTTVNKFNVLKSKEVEKTGLLNYIKRAYSGEHVSVPEYEFNPSGETESKGFGRNRWLSTSVFPLKDSKGKVKNIVITHEDISERKYSEEKIIQAMEKAEESDQLKTMFLANLSHEIRTPMNGILGFADLLKDTDMKAEKHDVYLDVIRKSGERMLYIINELIDISQIESGGVKLRNEVIDCNELLNDLYYFFLEEAKRKNIKLIQHNADAADSKLCADKTRLSQVLTNLIKNAFKFTSSGHIKFGFTKLDTHTEFFVEDTGMGIAPEIHNKIFERFRQGDLTIEKAEEGLGLGLSISKSLVKIMGGDLSLKSKPGKGSVFTFTIADNKPDGTAGMILKPEYSLERFYAQELSILIAEDDEISFQFFKELMLNTPNKLYFARTGKQAINLVNSTEGIDIILMDIKMPELDGISAIKAIREKNKTIPIIVQSAFASDLDIEKAMTVGANDFISKPINSKILISLIQKYTPEYVKE